MADRRDAGADSGYFSDAAAPEERVGRGIDSVRRRFPELAELPVPAEELLEYERRVDEAKAQRVNWTSTNESHAEQLERAGLYVELAADTIARVRSRGASQETLEVGRETFVEGLSQIAPTVTQQDARELLAEAERNRELAQAREGWTHATDKPTSTTATTASRPVARTSLLSGGNVAARRRTSATRGSSDRPRKPSGDDGPPLDPPDPARLSAGDFACGPPAAAYSCTVREGAVFEEES